jgi:alpha-glucosidase
MSRKYWLFLSILFFSSSASSQSNPYQILSPDGKMAVNISLNTEKGLTYQLSYLNQAVVLESKFGINVNGEKWEQNLVIKNIASIAVDTVWKPIYGERSAIKDQYKESIFYVNKTDNKNKELKIIVRV